MPIQSEGVQEDKHVHNVRGREVKQWVGYKHWCTLETNRTGLKNDGTNRSPKDASSPCDRKRRIVANLYRALRDKDGFDTSKFVQEMIRKLAVGSSDILFVAKVRIGSGARSSDGCNHITVVDVIPVLCTLRRSISRRIELDCIQRLVCVHVFCSCVELGAQWIDQDWFLDNTSVLERF